MLPALGDGPLQHHDQLVGAARLGQDGVGQLLGLFRSERLNVRRMDHSHHVRLFRLEPTQQGDAIERGHVEVRDNHVVRPGFEEHQRGLAALGHVDFPAGSRT